MFGCYRKDDVHDADVYLQAVELVLSEYPRAVVEYVTDPRTGLPGREKSKYGVPTAGEVKAACDAEVARAHRMEQPALRRLPRDYQPPPSFPGCRANVFVRAAAPQYAAMLEWHKTADERDWKWDERGRDGIWVALLAFQQFGSGAALPQPTPISDDALRASLARVGAVKRPEELAGG